MKSADTSSAAATGSRRVRIFHRSTVLRMSAVTAAAASLVLVAACGGGEDEPSSGETSTAAAADVLGPLAKATGEPVKIGVISDGRAAHGDLSVQFDVADATAKYLNDHLSGIGGRPIEIVTCETGGDPAKGGDCGNQMVKEGVIAVAIGETTALDDAWTPLHDAKIPVMLYGGGGKRQLEDAQSTFMLTDAVFASVTLPIQLAEEKGAKKVTSVVIDVPAAISLLETSATPEYKRLGIENNLVRIPPGTPDMTPQMRQATKGDPGIIYVLGNDPFCIAAFNGLRAVGFKGDITSIAQCVTDATREAVPGDFLEGMTVSASAPLGTDNPSSRLYNAVVDAYGSGDIDTSTVTGMTMFITLSGLQAATADISGDITPATVTAAIKAMPEKELPGTGGMKFRCNGKAFTNTPAVCVRGGLVTTLDGKGQPAEYKTLGNTPIKD
ncbi:branched-chain amino acid transport system substrate-binding protein [Parafrankia irregularis]|uniref:Branched-chain amino acid transport system substrate-binding protein n=1 Tax=Parafrankia irregularis TaxID=795642 RepID=A0A0S4QU34_9ACTN|nr:MULTISPECIES: ABC transporter substrate-binding protein [Parafrankia]MBE3199995.1 ABC transporter substrate-binding protein [Parafrankia sp. CH37]CUU59259.1 branched-chain amino acid transport system substrate-binding protein [Parafrankia irregularis]